MLVGKHCDMVELGRHVAQSVQATGIGNGGRLRVAMLKLAISPSRFESGCRNIFTTDEVFV